MEQDISFEAGISGHSLGRAGFIYLMTVNVATPVNGKVLFARVTGFIVRWENPLGTVEYKFDGIGPAMAFIASALNGVK